MSKPETTDVIFRRWSNGDIIALFPGIAADEDTFHCQSYEHVGQHGAADMRIVTPKTRHATAAECAGLKEELEHIGYRLRVVKRVTMRHFQQRYNQLQSRGIEAHT